jgi:hypothetical protein
MRMQLKVADLATGLSDSHYVSLVDGATCMDGHCTGLCSTHRIM